MDPVRVGKLLALLRNETGMTQQEMGEILGVSNKTISRWENGNYMPDIALLPRISELFGISINELLAGQRLDAPDYPKKAEKYLPESLEKSRFSVEDRRVYWKRRWLRAHAARIMLCACTALGSWIWAIAAHNSWLYAVLPAGCLGFYLFFHNQMAGYIEQKAYAFPAIRKNQGTWDACG